MTCVPSSASSERQASKREAHDDDTFRYAPVPLWLEDWSGVKALLDEQRRDGVHDLADHLSSHPELVEEAASRIRILNVNAKTLALLEASSLRELQDNLTAVFSKPMLATHRGELCQLFDGQNSFESLAINYTLGGEPLDIQVKGQVLPGAEDDWSRVLVSTENVTVREQSLRRLRESEAFARGLFEHSPISLWVEDFSEIKNLIDDVRSSGVTDFQTFVDVHPEFVDRCMREIRVIDVNQHTLDLFGATDKHELLSRLSEIFRGDMHPHFREQLIKLWNGELFHSREVINYDLHGNTLHVHMQFTVFPGHEHDWSLTKVALTDITARKKAESYLEYLGKHDVLTKLKNRSFFDDELKRLERLGQKPITIIVADLNGLKPVNDELGHAAGDALLRRAGEVLREAVSAPCYAARIGGDEFVIMMPASEESEGLVLVAQIEKLVTLNNQFYPGPRLSFSIGLASSDTAENLEDLLHRADQRMYDAKRTFYQRSQRDRHQLP